MADHTPGPWRVTIYPSIHSSMNTRLYVDSYADVTVASLEVERRSGTYKQDLEETEANANLIAAAPDLLAALEEMEINCDMYPDAPYHEQARAAIAKARGQK